MSPTKQTVQSGSFGRVEISVERSEGERKGYLGHWMKKAVFGSRGPLLYDFRGRAEYSAFIMSDIIRMQGLSLTVNKNDGGRYFSPTAPIHIGALSSTSFPQACV